MAKYESIREQMFTNIISWQSSEFSQKEWCQQQGITYHVFHYSYLKYRELHPESTDTSSFVRLSVKPADNASCEIIFVDGTKIVFREPVPVHYLKNLLF
jgi:hypothetical protein